MENTSASQSQVIAVPQEIHHKKTPAPFVIVLGAVLFALITGVIGYYLGSIMSSDKSSRLPVQEDGVAEKVPSSPMSSEIPPASPEGDATARGGGGEESWQTYSDMYNSYSIKYPEEWELKKSTCASCAMNLVKKPIMLPDGTKDVPSTIGIMVFDTRSQQLKDWQNTKVVSQNSFSLSELRGLSRMEKRDSFSQMGEAVEMEVLYVEKGSKTYVIYTIPAILPAENAILSTLTIK